VKEKSSGTHRKIFLGLFSWSADDDSNNFIATRNVHDYLCNRAFFIKLSTYKGTGSCLENKIYWNIMDYLIHNGRHQYYPEPDESRSHPHALFTLK
jgi:hypothetical protein